MIRFITLFYFLVHPYPSPYLPAEREKQGETGVMLGRLRETREKVNDYFRSRRKNALDVVTPECHVCSGDTAVELIVVNSRNSETRLFVLG